MKILFMGQSSSFSLIPLRAVSERHTFVGIVESTTKKYRPFLELCKRRIDGKDGYQSLRFFAREKSIPYYAMQNKSQSDLANFTREVHPDIICVSGFSRLLKEEVFSIPPYGAINFHPALLPRYRGPNPLFWHYYFMEHHIGATIHYIDPGEDTGDIILQKSVPIYFGMRGTELGKKIMSLGAELIVEALTEISKGNVKRTPQKDIPCPFRARHRKPDEQLLQWDWPIERVWHFLRGTTVSNKELTSKFPGLSWTVKDFEKDFTNEISGDFRWSLQGFYLSHKEGRIFVRPTWSTRKFLRHAYHKLLK
jgi:methionyl-tRNA formyltransferase